VVFATATRASVHRDPATESGVVPGNEVVGRIDAIGGRVTSWSVGDRVASALLAAAAVHVMTRQQAQKVQHEGRSSSGGKPARPSLAAAAIAHRWTVLIIGEPQ
jgi:NADPH:quinone reductase-like Zn-dependent oxidoreductase